ncbi:glycoside hydrolase family 78 protein [Blastococcus montanus]|uniref:glycoside hydrolase family 78 protein n=1 Tax=Blastococcus montanus TaxID=3144973 RepID=UPI00320B2EAC
MPTTVTVSAPRFEHHREALGIGEAAPRLSWKVTAPPDWRQRAYEVEATGEGRRWASGRIESPDSVLVPWPTGPLASRERRVVRIRVWGDGPHPSSWSSPAPVEAGLLDPGDWTAVAVTPSWPADRDGDEPPPLVRTSFTVGRQVAQARLYVTAHGLYEVELNGHRVGDDALAPGWTSYSSRLRYATHDVTSLLVEGENAVGAWLADGWYRGRLGFHGGHRNLYGDRVALLAQLEVRYTDGTGETVATGPRWRAGLGPIARAGLYEGERYDARREPAGWSRPGFDDSGWAPVVPVERDPATLVAPTGPPVRCTGELRPVSIGTSPSGATIVDFGQNIAGRLRIRVDGPAGTTVRLRHAEVLEDGELCTRPLRGAEATDEYTLRGGGVETWEPRFTFHGFRYAEITGWPGEPAPGDVVARVYHTDMERTGWFECSDPLVSRLHENVVWSMRGNFVDLPTDCPQRDERLGWTGDLQVFAPTAGFLYDCAGMVGSWLRDVAAEQYPDGTIPWYVPEIPGGDWTPANPGAVWGDVAVLTPAVLYERFGDSGVLRTQYASAKAWVDCVAARVGDDGLWDHGMQLGDWLDPAAPPEDPAAARTDRYLVATAYHAWSALHLSRIAGVLGELEDEKHYGAMAERVAAAFAAEYVSPTGRVVSDAQTAYALALVFDLIPSAAQRARAGRRLAELVAEGGNRIATGFAGTPVVCDALSSVGREDAAYALLLERSCPSWLYPVTQGATTIWERWDSLLPDGTVNPGDMTSFNHYALGAVADWLHRVVAGLAPAAPGYRRILVRPRPGGGLTSARARHETPYGPAEVSWRLAGPELTVRVEVPTGTTATVDLPGAEPAEIGPGTHCFEVTLR